MGVQSQSEGILMFETLKEQIPLFFSYHNVVFILEAMGRTLGMTVIGCTVGFVFGLLIALLRHSKYKPLLRPGARGSVSTPGGGFGSRGHHSVPNR